MTDPIPPALVARVWQILVEECGCSNSTPRFMEFRYYLGRQALGGHEFRFVGALGFGGKFYNDGRKWWVSCYREHENPERLAMIERANARLAALRDGREGDGDAG